MLTNVKNKISTIKNNKVVKNVSSFMGALAMSSYAYLSMYACAADPTELVALFIKIMVALIIVYGILLFVGGLVAYASSHAEGDGPAQNKAIGKMAAAAMIVILSIILTLNANTLTSYITTNIN